MGQSTYARIPRLDRQQLEDLIAIDDGRTALAREIRAACFGASRERFDAIASALESHDLTTIERQLHAFKTSCHTAGLSRAYEMSHELHLKTSDASVSFAELKRRLCELKEEVDAALDEVADFLLMKEMGQAV